MVEISEEDEVRFIYNGLDNTYTLEIFEVQEELLLKESKRLQDLYRFQLDELSPILVDRMNKGVRIDKEEKERLYKIFSELMEDIKQKINSVLGFEFNINSSQQKKKVFSDFLGIKLKKKKRKGKEASETCDAAAMLEYITEYPLYKPFLTLLLEHAAIKVFTTTFLGMKLDEDDRARTQYRIAGTATGRLASTKNVFGSGGNFQNIPEKGKVDLRYAIEVMEEEAEEEDFILDTEVEGTLELPNIKRMFLPDIGMELCDADYSGADIQIVAWESECKWLMDYFENPRGNGKVYQYIAENYLQREISTKEYKVYKGIKHGLNYGMGIEKLAITAGISFGEAERYKNYYFSLVPEIPKWQKKINETISKRGWIENIFGRKGWFINKNDPTLLNKALAFTPQSTIGDLVNHAIVNIKKHSEIDLLLQVHDSGVFQYPIERAEECRRKIKKGMLIELPYQKPLIIPADIKVSTISYGDCSKPPVKKIGEMNFMCHD